MRLGATAIALVLGVLACATRVPAQQTGPFIKVPSRAGDVYVPLDASGNPTTLGAPRVPAAPAAPASSAAPAVPASPSERGSLRIEGAPTDATVFVDGQKFGAAQWSARLPEPIALGPGQHQIEIVLPGVQPIRLTVEIGGRQEPTRGGGYFVVPKP